MRAYRYRLRLKKPIVLGASSYSFREGVLLERDGQWADAAPLPHFSRDTIEDVIAALRDDAPVPVSLQFALDCLAGPPSKACCVPVNALLLGARKEILAAAELLRAQHCSAVKLKVGRAGLQDDIELVRDVARVLGSKTQLRLDANRAWSLQDAAAFAIGIKDVEIQYIEEPLREPAENETLFSKFRIPYALDETLSSVLSDDELVNRFPNASAYVVKPTIIGGRRRIETWANRGMKMVFSAAFESGVGIARIAQQALEFSPQTPAGLDTYSWLAEDVLCRPLALSGGVLTIHGKLDVDRTCLEEIAIR